jgi:predicted peroxiredoxin
MYANVCFLTFTLLLVFSNSNKFDAGGVYFQNLDAYKISLYSGLKNKMPKLNALQDSEELSLQEYLDDCMVRGHRMAICALSINNENLLTENVTISIESTSNHLNNVEMPEYDCMDQFVYSQFKSFRNQSQSLLTQEEVLEITRLYIQSGYKHTMANHMSIRQTAA